MRTRVSISLALTGAVILLVFGQTGCGNDSSNGDDAAACLYDSECPHATCVFGTCISNPFECNPSQVTCGSEAPSCAPGETPSVVDGCWDECVPLAECDILDGCTVCEQSDWVCVWGTLNRGDDIFKCVPRDEDCDPENCDCDPDPCEPLDCGTGPSSSADVLQCSQNFSD